jgi:hypothetical protein
MGGNPLLCGHCKGVSGLSQIHLLHSWAPRILDTDQNERGQDLGLMMFINSRKECVTSADWYRRQI